MPVSTGSDTRMYSPRSESNLGYANDAEDNPHGVGDPETMEQLRDKRMAEAENKQTVHDLPHLRIDVPNPEPEMPPVPDMPEEPMMDDDNENARGAEVSQMTGMPDMGNLSIGNATGTMPQPGGMLATGEPMDDAWSSLLKMPQMSVHPVAMKDWEEDLRLALMNRILAEDPAKNLGPGRFNPIGWTSGGPLGGKSRRPRVRMKTDKVIGADTKQKLRDAGFTIHGSPKEYSIKPHVKEVYGPPYYKPVPELIEPTSEEKRLMSQPIETSSTGKGGTRTWSNDERQWRFQQRRGGAEDWDTKDWEPSENVQTGEPMDDAWSELMKARSVRSMGRSKSRAWKQPQYKIQPGGSDISTATSRRSKLYSRHLQPHKHRGIDRAPLSVHRTHLGIATKQPLRLFPRDYGQQTGSMQRRKWQGNIPAGHPSGHAMGPEVTYNPRAPKAASSEGRKIRAPGTPRLRGQTMGIKNTLKSEDVAGIKEDLSLIEKKMSYMHFAQMRRLMRKVKEALADKERRLKARVSSGPGKQRESGHMEGQDKTTRPTGATDSLDIPESWGAPSTMFAARGSGRVG